VKEDPEQAEQKQKQSTTQANDGAAANPD